MSSEIGSAVAEPYRKDYIKTFLGNRIYFLNPRMEDISLIDTAKGLSHESRFGGQTKGFYSVAQHAVLVSELVFEKARKYKPRNRIIASLQGLHHDDSEGLGLKDLPAPLKAFLPEYRRLEELLQRQVYRKYDLPSVMLSVVAEADSEVYLAEERDLRDALFASSHSMIHPWTSGDAERRYLERHKQLLQMLR